MAVPAFTNLIVLFLSDETLYEDKSSLKYDIIIFKTESAALF